MDNLIESLERDKQMIFGLRLNRIAEDIDNAIELLKEQQEEIEKLKTDRDKYFNAYLHEGRY